MNISSPDHIESVCMQIKHKYLLPLWIGIAVAVIIGLFRCQDVISRNDYAAYRLYFTIASILISEIDHLVFFAVPAIYGIFFIFQMSAHLRNPMHRSILRTTLTAIVIVAAAKAEGRSGVLTSLAEWYRTTAHHISESSAMISETIKQVANPSTLKAAFSESPLLSLFLVLVVILGTLLLIRIHRREESSEVAEDAAAPSAKSVQSPIRLNPVSGLGKPGVFLSRLILTVSVAVFLFVNISWVVLHTRNAIYLKNNPNVIFIMIDALRADHLKCYGYERSTSPNIDRLASESIQFNRAISQAPWTFWSISSFMTSRYPESFNLGTSRAPGRLSDGALTLAEVLKERGYSTNSIISNLFAGRKFNATQGYDFVDESICQQDITSPRLLSKIQRRIARIKDKKFFLFALFFDPHCPYERHKGFDYDPDYRGQVTSPFTPPTVFDGRKRLDAYSERDIKHMKALYDGEIKFTDDHIGKLIDTLKRNGLYDSSMIILVSDHGETFHDHGTYIHEWTLYDELLSVPLLVKLPKQEHGRRVTGTFRLIDLFPSIMKLLGYDASPYHLEGSSRDFKSVDRLPNTDIFSASDSWGKLRSIEHYPYKYIERTQITPSEKIPAPEYHLFNLAKDPREHNDLVDKEADMRSGLATLLHAHNESVEKTTNAKSDINLNEAEKARLKSLGYAQ